MRVYILFFSGDTNACKIEDAWPNSLKVEHAHPSVAVTIRLICPEPASSLLNSSPGSLAK